MTWVVQAATDDERRACEAILRALPTWFGIEEAIQHYAQEIRTLPTFVAVEAGQVCGFVTLYHHNPYTSEIYVMAVRQAYHRRGMGRALIAQAETVCRPMGVEYLQVKTLGSAHPSVDYAQTRHFYRACGFRPLEELAGVWPGNPCLILIKRL